MKLVVGLLPCVLEDVEEFAHLLVEIRDVGEVGATRPADVFLGDVEAAPVVGIKDALGVVVLVLVAKVRHLRQQMLATLVQVPEPLARHVGIMRVGEADGKAPRAVVLGAGKVIELGAGHVGDLVVILHLVGDLGDAGAGDRAHVVIPPVDAFARFAVIRGPAEIGGVDVGGQAFLKPVHLVGADEMHLAAEAGVITCAAQVVRVGGQIRRKLGGIVVDAGDRRQFARHEARAARCTERRGGVAIAEPGGFRRQPLHVGGVKPVGGTVGEEGPVQLVDHDDEDIGARCHASAFSSLSSAAITWAEAEASGSSEGKCA